MNLINTSFFFNAFNEKTLMNSAQFPTPGNIVQCHLHLYTKGVNSSPMHTIYIHTGLTYDRNLDQEIYSTHPTH